MGWMIALAVAAALVFMTRPGFRRSRVKPWRMQKFAHRGLHDIGAGVVENTIPAFEAACAEGYGIELDIQFSRDMQVVVFHDDDLKRLAGDPRRVFACDLQTLRSFPLAGFETARIPTLREALDCVNGRTRLLIELKSGPRNPQLCRALMEHLKDYPGEYVIESFNPLIVGWFRRNAPQVVRGQLVCPMKHYIAKASRISGLFMSGLLLNCIGRPDFVAYDANAARFFSPHFQRFVYRTPMAGWTVRTPEMEALIEHRGEMSIFENIRPRRCGGGDAPRL